MPDGMPKTLEVPASLIYEMDEGMPLYFRDYRKVLQGLKTAEEVMGSSLLQALLIELIKDYLKPALGSAFVVLASELGLQLSKKSWRNADIAVFRKKDILREGLPNAYTAIPPLLVIEINTKADLEDHAHPETYYHRKTDQLLEFGVEQVLWVFTTSQKCMLAERGKRWEICDWSETLSLRLELQIHVAHLLDAFQQEDQYLKKKPPTSSLAGGETEEKKTVSAGVEAQTGILPRKTL